MRSPSPSSTRPRTTRSDRPGPRRSGCITSRRYDRLAGGKKPPSDLADAGGQLIDAWLPFCSLQGHAALQRCSGSCPHGRRMLAESRQCGRHLMSERAVGRRARVRTNLASSSGRARSSGKGWTLSVQKRGAAAVRNTRRMRMLVWSVKLERGGRKVRAATWERAPRLEDTTDSRTRRQDVTTRHECVAIESITLLNGLIDLGGTVRRRSP